MKTITGTWTNPDGTAVANGFLLLKLSNDSALVAGSSQVAPTILSISLNSSGAIPANTQIYANDELLPNGTFYFVSVFNASMGKVYGPEQFSITGSSPVNLNTITPTSGSNLGFPLPGPTFQQFTSSGTFTIPNNITKVKVTVIGAGGAGGGGTASINGGGGAAGGAAYAYLSGLTPGNTITVTVGAGGTGNAGAAGNAGGNTSISSGTQSISTITAFGGAGGLSVAATSLGGGQTAQSTGGTTNLGGAGGGAGMNGVAGGGGNSILGGGANSPGLGGIVGNPAVAPGSGGSGGTSGASVAGGPGALGIVIFEWIS